MTGLLGEPNDRNDLVGGRREALQGRLRIAHKMLLVEQILGGISREDEFAKHDKLGASLARGSNARGNRCLICRDISDRRVGLAKRDAHSV
jgi:hypothetical protein